MLRGVRRLPYADTHMRNLLLSLLHLAIVAARLCGPGGVRAVMSCSTRVSRAHQSVWCVAICHRLPHASLTIPRRSP